jgi:hypothetical protein
MGFGAIRVIGVSGFRLNGNGAVTILRKLVVGSRLALECATDSCAFGDCVWHRLQPPSLGLRRARGEADPRLASEDACAALAASGTNRFERAEL